jgi:hypothetical protein
MTEDQGNIHLTVTLREWTRLVIASEKQQAYHSGKAESQTLVSMWHWEQEQGYKNLANKLRKQHAEGDA